ncbi:MAG: T9SS type A sorting domain-containing protein [Saprospiraceae bacterium]|nr:T9SS type A sorting domain-containing protein [Saprospiraceae bacterium]
MTKARSRIAQNSPFNTKLSPIGGAESLRTADYSLLDMRHLCSIILLLCWTNVINAQQITFSKVFSNFQLNPENGVVIKETNDGYLLLSFSSCLDNNNESCCALTKLDQYGSIEWFKQYPFHQGSNTLVVHSDLIYVAGHTNEPNSRYTLYCIDSLGEVVWNKVYGDSTKNSQFPRLALWGDKWVLCGGQDRNINNHRAQILYFVVTDFDGEQINEFYYGEDDLATLAVKSIVSTQGDCISSFVYCPSGCFLDLKAGVVAFDTSGILQWELDLPFSYNPYECVLAQIDSNTLAIKWFVDNTTIPNHDLTPPAIFLTDMSGNVLDTVVFQNQTLKEVRNMEPVWESGLVGCGHEYPNYINLSNPKLFGWLFRMDENREVLWERSYLDSTYQGRTFGLLYVIPTSDGGYLATGTITNYMTGVWESHNWLLKLDSMGCLEPGCSNVNYITETEEAVFLKGKDIKIYPNPASDYVQVEFPADFDIGQNAYAVLVSNTGSIVRQEKINASKSQLNLSGITSGMYYLMIRRGNEIIGSKRIVVHQ